MDREQSKDLVAYLLAQFVLSYHVIYLSTMLNVNVNVNICITGVEAYTKIKGRIPYTCIKKTRTHSDRKANIHTVTQKNKTRQKDRQTNIHTKARNT